MVAKKREEKPEIKKAEEKPEKENDDLISLKDEIEKYDDDYEMRKTAELERGLYAKFSQNIYLRNMLLNTLDAKLMHFRRGKPPLVCTELMKVRRRLRNEICNLNK